MNAFARHTRCLLLLLAAAAGCSKSQAPDTPPGPEPGVQPIVWNVDMERSAAASRSLIGSQADMGDISIKQACTPVGNGGEGEAIGIWADYTYRDADGMQKTVKNLFEGTRLIYADKVNGNPYDDWNYAGTDLYWFVGGKYKFRGYFPQKLEDQVLTTSDATTFAMTYSTSDYQEDLLVAYNEVDTTDPSVDLSQPVTLNFKHALAAVRFRVEASYDNTDYLTSCYLQNADTKDFASIGILVYGTETAADDFFWSMSYNPPATERIYYWSNSGVEFSTDTQTSTVRPALAYTQAGTTSGEQFTRNDGWLLILPQASSGNLQFCFTTRNAEEGVYRVTIPKGTEYDDNGGVISEEYRPGKRYTYTIRINEADVELTITAADWNVRDSSYDIEL